MKRIHLPKDTPDVWHPSCEHTWRASMRQSYSLRSSTPPLGAMQQSLQLMALKCTSPGPPLDVILNWIVLPTHRAALSALFCGDFFLARYAANYFAKGLVPQNASLQRELASVGLEADRVCLHCWNFHNKLSLERQAHVLLDCTCYSQCRSTFVASFDETNQAIVRTCTCD